MDGPRLRFSLPLRSIIPAVIGAVMLWAVVMIFGLLQFTSCPTWKFSQSAPNSDLRIIGAIKGKVYLQANNGPIYCHTQGQWQECTISTFALSYKDAPAWLNPYFTSIPERASIVQLTRVENITSTDYYALLENDQIWVCPTDFFSELEHILSSRAVFWLLLPAGIGLWCAAILLKIFAEEGSPIWRDFWGGRIDK